jgi:diguanylate cyclase (GGDEF)-like protein
MVVTVAIVIVELVISFDPRVNATAVIVRRVVFWGVLGLVISFSVHGLRDRLRAAFREREQLHANQAEHLRRTEALGLAAEELTAYRDPLQVVTAASRLAAQVAAPPGAGPRRAQYVRLFGHIGRRVALYDEVAGEGLGTDFPIAEHPALERAFVTGEASHGPLDPAISGPTVQAMLLSLGLTHGVYVPIMVDGVIDGVLMVALRGGAPPGDLLEQCKALGHLTELALRNALAHELLQDMATTDALTGVANRRSFEQLMTQHPGRRPYAVLVLDVDGLKAVNDTYGHLAGDRMLVEVAASLTRVMRRGDVLARVGGDEFAVFAVDADLEAGREIAERMLLALSRARIVGGAPRASIGVAVGTEGDDALEVFGAADAAMYAAKREGGERFALSASSHR